MFFDKDGFTLHRDTFLLAKNFTDYLPMYS